MEGEFRRLPHYSKRFMRERERPSILLSLCGFLLLLFENCCHGY